MDVDRYMVMRNYRILFIHKIERIGLFFRKFAHSVYEVPKICFKESIMNLKGYGSFP
jgi:hypothetical protein